MNISDYKLIAHRGLHSNNGRVPENSLEAFNMAIQHDFAIEFDVRLTSDGKLIVFHDKNLKRITGTDMIVEDCTLKSLKELKLGNTNFTIPTLQEVLSLVDCKVPLLIEIKNERKVGPLERKILKILTNYKGKYIIESFNPLSLLWFRRNAPNIVLGQLSSKKFDGMSSWIKRFILKNMLLNPLVKPNFIAYELRYITPKLAQKFKKHNRYLFGFTVQSDESLKKAKYLCDGIIFDNMVPIENNEL